MKKEEAGKKDGRINWEDVLLVLIICAILIQIFFAGKWIVGNGLFLQKFQETSEYMHNARSMSSNGWTLIGYSLFLRLFLSDKGGMAVGSGSILILFLVQFLCAFICFTYLIWDFISMLIKRKQNWIWGICVSLYICTFPGMLQTICSALPDIWIQIIMGFIFIKGSKLIFRQDSIKPVESILTGTAAGLLCIVNWPAFWGAAFYIILLLVFYFIRNVFITKQQGWLRKEKKVFQPILLLACSLLCTVLVSVVINEITVEKQDNYMRFRPLTALWFDVAYSNLEEDYIFFSEKTQNAVSFDELRIISEEKEYVRNSLQAVLLARTCDQKIVDEIYKNMIMTTLQHHSKDYLLSKIKEISSVIGFPLSYLYHTFLSYNEEQIYYLTRMWERDWIDTCVYLRIGGSVYAFAFAFGVLSAVLSSIPWKKLIYPFVYGIVSIIAFSWFVFTFGTTGYDFRLENFAFFLWTAGIAILLNYSRQKGQKRVS